MVNNNKHITISANDVAIGYRHKKNDIIVSQHINFEITQGTLAAIVGTNGIGKSTLLKTLTALLPALKGSIKIDGKENTTFTPLALANHVSVVLTEAPASKNLSVLELVSLGRQPYTNWMGTLSQHDITLINEALAATDLTTLAHKKCIELSDGQLQRVYIARALAQDTPLILLDEPTTHLDLHHRAYIIKLLKKVAQEKNKTILFSTHEIDLAIQISDKILVMKKEATFFDTPKNLIEKGVFNTLFPNDVVVFNKNTGRFSIQ